MRLVPDSGATQLSVTFRGVLQSAPNATTFAGLQDEPSSVPPPASGWRWGVVAIDSSGRARYSSLQRRYPWMVQLAGAMPLGFEPNAQPPVPSGRQHPNGGGWIATNAEVDASAFVGPNARVLGGAVRGNARIEDHAVVVSGEVRDGAVVSALTIVSANTVVRDQARAATVFMPLGAFERNIVLSDTAQNIGDVEQRGASIEGRR